MDLYQGFAKSLSLHSKTSKPTKNEEFLNLIQSFSAISLNFWMSKDKSNKDIITAKLYENLALETNSWSLISRLYQRRLSQEEKVADDCDLTELHAIRDWLYRIKRPEEVSLIETRTNGWVYTAKRLNTGVPFYQDLKRRRTIVGHLDPDAMYREEPLPLETKDQEYEEEFLKVLYEHSRRGRVDIAEQLCRKNNDFWRAASIRGIVPFHSSIAEEELYFEKAQFGNQNLELWLQTCRTLTNSEHVFIYEKALYSVLSGDYKNLLPVCQSWEDHLFAYINAKIIYNMFKYAEIFPLDALLEDPDLDSIFANLENNTDPAICRSACHLHHIAQAIIMTNQTKEIIPRLFKDYLLEPPSSSEFNDPLKEHQLRFLIHLALSLQMIGLPVADEHLILLIEKYSSILWNIGLVDNLALYCSFLPTPALKAERYGFFLKDLMRITFKEKCHYIDLGKQYGIDPAETAQTIVSHLYQNLTGTTFETVSLEQLTYQEMLTGVEMTLIDALDWLLTDDQQRFYLLTYANLLIRYFLLNGANINAVKEIITKIPDNFDSISAQPDLASKEGALVFELKAYTKLVEFFLHYQKLEMLNLSSDIDYLSKRVQIMELVKSIELEARMMLQADLFVPRNVDSLPLLDEVRSVQLGLLKTSFIPIIVEMFYQALYSSRQYQEGNLEKSVYLISEIIADEDYQLYKCFNAGTLKRLFLLLRKSFLELA